VATLQVEQMRQDFDHFTGGGYRRKRPGEQKTGDDENTRTAHDATITTDALDSSESLGA
jgi:hypothetical protein